MHKHDRLSITLFVLRRWLNQLICQFDFEECGRREETFGLRSVQFCDGLQLCRVRQHVVGVFVDSFEVLICGGLNEETALTQEINGADKIRIGTRDKALSYRPDACLFLLFF